MIHILYLSESDPNPPFLEDLESQPDIQFSFKSEYSELDNLLPSGWFDVCMIWTPEARLLDLNRVSHLRKLAPECALVILAPPVDKEWEWSALQLGADLVVQSGIQPNALIRIIERLGRPVKNPYMVAKPGPIRSTPAPFASPLSSRSALSLFRDVSRVLSETNNYQRMTEQFVLKLRDLVGVHKIAIFMEAADVAGLSVFPSDTTKMPCLAAFGVPPDLRNCLELTRYSGLGKRMEESPTVIHLNYLDDMSEGEQIRKEIQIPGGVIALPINDRERNLGVAIIGERLTGPLQEDDLQLITLLLEELGVAVRNSWLQLQRNEDKKLLDDMFSSLHSGFLVVGQKGESLYVNRAFREAMSHRGLLNGPVIENQLPEEIRQRIIKVREENIEADPFLYVDEQLPLKTFQVSLIPLGPPLVPPRPILLVLEDFTHVEIAKRTEVETSQSRLTALIAKRFAHEIRNSLVPLTTHLQLFDDRIGDVEFLKSLKQSLTNEAGRIQRFTDQMLFFSPRGQKPLMELDLLGLLQSVYSEVCAVEAEPFLEIQLKGEVQKIFFSGEPKSFSHALKELFLNAVQADVDRQPPKTLIRMDEGGLLEIHVMDKGRGFGESPREKAFEPFFTTKNTGIGLGLSVARKIVEDHSGTIAIQDAIPPFETDQLITIPFIRTECLEQIAHK